MKKILLLIIATFAFAFAHSQNKAEAKMAFQMAEEKFDAKQYSEALTYLQKAETALGTTNPPIAYLRVMVSDQLATESPKDATGKESLMNLEKAIANFEKTKGKENLGEGKLMEVYRIKMELDKRNQELVSNINSMKRLENEKQENINKILSQLPRVGIPLSEFLEHEYCTRIKGKIGANYNEILKRKRGEFGMFFDLFSTPLGNVFKIKTDENGNVTYYAMSMQTNLQYSNTMYLSNEELGVVFNLPFPSHYFDTVNTKEAYHPKMYEVINHNVKERNRKYYIGPELRMRSNKLYLYIFASAESS